MYTIKYARRIIELLFISEEKHNWNEFDNLLEDINICEDTYNDIVDKVHKNFQNETWSVIKHERTKELIIVLHRCCLLIDSEENI